MHNEVSFSVTSVKADRFCAWLVGLGGWAATSPVEHPIIHRLIRIQNPENTVGIPRQDLVVSQKEGSSFFEIRREFHPLFQAWLAYDICQYKGE